MISTATPWFDTMRTKVTNLPKNSDRAQTWESLLVAVHFRVIYFGYHRDEFNRLIAEEESANVPDEELEQAFSAAAYGEPAWQQLSMNAVLAAGQLTAATHSMHAACDIMCRIAYWALGLNTTALSLSLGKLNMHDLIKHSFGQSRVELERLEQCEEFRYLDAFIHASRHRHLVSAAANMAIEGCKRGGDLAILGFQDTRGGKTCDYPARCAARFLDDACEKIVDQCNTLGKALAHDMV